MKKSDDIAGAGSVGVRVAVGMFGCGAVGSFGFSFSLTGQDDAGGFASVILDPAGANNAILFTAVEAGAAGNDITVAIATPAVSAETAVSVTGNAITVTPGTKAVIVVNGLSESAANGVYPRHFTGSWRQGDYGISNASGTWTISRILAGGIVATGVASSGVTWPDDETWTPSTGVTGTPSVTAAVSSAALIIAAITASGPASALVTAENAPGNDGSGPMAAVAATNLSGGSEGIPANVLTLTGEILTLDGQNLTLN